MDMGFKKAVAKLLPYGIRANLHVKRAARQFQSMPRIDCPPHGLRNRADLPLDEIFRSTHIEAEWKEASQALERFSIPDSTGGVNPGDRRALFHLVHFLKPQSVLEIGTHIGASTVHIASAMHLAARGSGKPSHLITVDISDVNSAEQRPWRNFGMEHSPAQMLEELQLGVSVEFVCDRSTDFARGSEEKFDLIFLDGDHSAGTVYQEIPMAINLLKEGGCVLLHDYFPGLEPLWSDGSVIPGPYLGAQRHMDEGAGFQVLPLGELPWPTKSGSKKTSLALLAG
jgi:predicted O-methyltransferase YrrM